MFLQKGDLILVPFPFTDLTATKIRPALVIWTDQLDVTVCFISSQNLSKISVEEFIVEELDPEFSQTGLKISSKIMVSKIVTIERSLIKRKLGNLGSNLLSQLDQCLRIVFKL
jgi:mRNA interferase MazF